MNIFLDDYRKPTDVRWMEIPDVAWTIVRNYDQFIHALDHATEAPKYITFDHDLADAHYDGDFSGPEKTGYDCAKALVEICLERNWLLPDYSVHSLNPIGAKNIREYLKNAKEHNVGL